MGKIRDRTLTDIYWIQTDVGHEDVLRRQKIPIRDAKLI